MDGEDHRLAGGQPNGDIVIRDFYGKIRGKYDKYCDVTRDFYGTILAGGDQHTLA